MKNTHDRSDAYALRGGYNARKFQFACIKEGKVSVLEKSLSSETFKAEMHQIFYDDVKIAAKSLIFLWAQAWNVVFEAGLPETKADEIYMQAEAEAEAATTVDKILEIHKNTISAFARAVYETKEKKEYSSKVLMCIDYIAIHLCDNPSPGEIADELGFSANYLSRLFKRETGQTISEYIQKERMDTAKLMLESSDMPISEIMSYLGYTSQSHFSENFKKATGLTPGKYRKNVKRIKEEAALLQNETFSDLAGNKTEEWFIKAMNYGKERGYEEQDYVISCIRRGKVSALTEMLTDPGYISRLEKLYEGSLARVTETVICVWPPAARAAIESGVDIEWISKHMQQRIAQLYACIDVEEALELNTRYLSELAQAVSEV